MSELKPCPFCGAATAAINDDHAEGAPDCGHYEIECGSCQAYAWGETLEKVSSTWNRRVEESDATFRVSGGFFGWLGLAIAAPILTVCFIVTALFLIVVGLPLTGVGWCVGWCVVELWSWNENRKLNAEMKRLAREWADRERGKVGARNG